MTVSSHSRRQVRERAHFACECCGITEVDAGGELTIDHFRPQAQGGSDELENLIYGCFRCNLHKSDYWPAADEPALWNPRREAFDTHFVILADGRLYPITPTGEFTLGKLNLNRAALVTHRLRRLLREALADLLAEQISAKELAENIGAQTIEDLQ